MMNDLSHFSNVSKDHRNHRMPNCEAKTQDNRNAGSILPQVNIITNLNKSFDKVAFKIKKSTQEPLSAEINIEKKIEKRFDGNKKRKSQANNQVKKKLNLNKNDLDKNLYDRMMISERNVNFGGRSNIHNKTIDDIIKASYVAILNKNVVPIKENLSKIPNFENTEKDDLFKNDNLDKMFKFMPKLKEKVNTQI
jgi:hypothetical protein